MIMDYVGEDNPTPFDDDLPPMACHHVVDIEKEMVYTIRASGTRKKNKKKRGHIWVRKTNRIADNNIHAKRIDYA
jgi:hypothetical protein